MNSDVYEIRRANLMVILQPRGAATDLANKMDTEPSYLSRLKSRNCRMGDVIARRIESVLGLGHGWMDHDHTQPSDQEQAEHVVLTAPDEESMIKLLRERGETYAFELLRKAFLQSTSKKDD